MFEPPRTGEVVLGRYRIEGPLGSGGMGIVLRATHLGLNQLVALKFMAPSAIEPEVATERFLREAQATFRLRSEHTVRVLDAGTLPNGAPVMVMELLEGQDLKAYLAQHGPLSAADAVEFAVQACDALAEAHTLGIVHRDLKARNLFISRRVNGTLALKILDFGISKIADPEGGPLTMPDTALGSPRYMAPEQWQSASTVDARADIYALGAVTYEMLTGKIPLAGLPLQELIKRIAAGSIPSPRELRPDLPDALCRVVLKALRPHPDERYPTAVHFAAALRGATPTAMSAKPKPNFAQTAPTAVMDKDAIIARAIIASMGGIPGVSAPAPVTVAVPPPAADTLEDIGEVSSTGPTASAVTAPAPAPAPHEFSFEAKTAVSAGNEPPRPSSKAQFAATLQVAQMPTGMAEALQRHVPLPPPPAAAVPLPPPPAPSPAVPLPPPPAPQPTSVLSMGLRDSVHPVRMNATISAPLAPMPLPPPPAPMHTPVMRMQLSSQAPPPAPAPALAAAPVPWQPPVHPSLPPELQPKSGFPWWIVALLVVTLFALAAGVGVVALLRR